MNIEPGQQPDKEDEPAGAEPTAAADEDVAAAASDQAAEDDGAGDDGAGDDAAKDAEAPAGGEAAVATPQEPAAAGGGGEQIEWRPVATGETIEWQPVVAGGGNDPGGEAAFEEPEGDAPAYDEPEFDEDAWEAALQAEPSSSGNGHGPGQDDRPGVAAHPARGPRRARPPARRPPPPPAGAPGEGASAGAGATGKQKRQVVILSVLTVFILLVAGVGFMLSRNATHKGGQASPGGSTPSTIKPATGGTTVPATDLTTWKDDQTGVSIRYPKEWKRLQPPVSDIRAVLVAGDGDAVNVRILPIQTVATQQNIGNFKAVTDAIVFGDNRNKLIQEQLVLLNGKLCYYYLYTFQDDATNQQGIHAHYFVFEGLRIVSVVFQSLPADDFTRQAAVFDQVAESIQVDPQPPGATAVPLPTTIP